MIDKRVKGQSQLDYLWTNFGNLEVSNKISQIPSDEVILTESAILKELQNCSTDVIIDSIDNEDSISIILKDHQNSVISHTEINKQIPIKSFSKFKSTQEDVDNKLVSKSDLICLKIIDFKDKEYIIELFPEVKGSETNSIITSVDDNKVAAQLKIDNPIVEKSVEIRQSTNGVQANLIVDDKSIIKVDKTKDGILVHQTWEGEDVDLKCRFLTTDEYLLILEPDNGTIYFLKDKPYIYFRKVKYGSLTEITGEENFYTKDEIDKLISTMSVGEANEIINEIFN